jgi:hypothetical protein
VTTTLAPAIGAPVLFTQQGVGTTPGYSATDLRRSDSGSLQEGVLSATASNQDFMVQQRIAGANMQVEITMPAGGLAAVQGDSITGQGLYDIPVHSTNVLETIGTADPTNPRIDQIILEVKDNVLDASGGNLAQTRVLAGTPTSGANLTNRTNAAALPGSALLLADVLVGAGVGTITNAVIRDRRKWARGAFSKMQRVAGDVGVTATSMAELDAANLNRRFETAGNGVRLTLMASAVHTAANISCGFGFFVDGVVGGEYNVNSLATAANAFLVCVQETVFPAAGSHTFSPVAFTSSGTMTVKATAARPLLFVVEEIVKQSAINNSVTTG